MYILNKLFLLIIFRKCIAFNYISVNYKYNNKELSDNKDGYDYRFPLNENINDIHNLELLRKKKVLLDILTSDVSIIRKLDALEVAKLNNIIIGDSLSPNLLKGGLLDDFDFEI